MSVTRRGFLATAGAVALSAQARAQDASAAPATPVGKTPLIDITDLYHPSQDPGDNFDLIAAYGLPEVDLKAVIFDVTNFYRRPHTDPANPYADPSGPRDPGIIPVAQLNYIFGRNIPSAPAPFERMKSPEDAMLDAPRYQQTGLELMFQILSDSKIPVEIASFGSARPLAVAYNREPKLMRDKVARIHLCAGAAPEGYLEWNVNLDVHAFVRILKSDLPVTIYPCATEKDPFSLGPYTCYWKLEHMQFLRDLPAPIQSYCAYAFEKSSRSDFLNAIEDPVQPEVMDRMAARPHSVWETAVWMGVARRALIQRPDVGYRIVPKSEVAVSDKVLVNDAVPCHIDVSADGQFRFEKTDAPTNFAIYYRDNPELNQTALREALPELYKSFRV